ncbi:MAG TPA: hypothetical protein VF251_15205 [Pyrinomonadaceae bacterium]
MNQPTPKISYVFRVGMLGASIVFVIAVALYLELSSHDPYSWAVAGEESDISRSLWLSRRTLYAYLAGVSFIAAFGLGTWSVILSRLRNR